MGTEIVDIKERIAQQLARQQENASALKTGVSFITFKNAALKVDGQPVPNNMAEVRVLSIVGERSWYDGPFDADTPQVPACYALNGTGVPHHEARDPQSTNCAECPKNKWGSAPPRAGSTLPGKGKACRESARVVVIPASVLMKSAPMYMAKIPVTSLPTVTAFSSRCSQSGKLSGEFITTLSVAEDKKSFFKVSLNIREHSPDIDLALLLARQDEAFEIATQPYPSFDEAA
jgi:hypothetical protein